MAGMTWIGEVPREERLEDPQLLTQGQRRPLAVGPEGHDAPHSHLREPGDVVEVGIHVHGERGVVLYRGDVSHVHAFYLLHAASY